MPLMFCFFCYSGMGPDSRVLVRKSRKQAQQYFRLYKVSCLSLSPSFFRDVFDYFLQLQDASGHVILSFTDWLRIFWSFMDPIRTATSIDATFGSLFFNKKCMLVIYQIHFWSTSIFSKVKKVLFVIQMLTEVLFVT